MSSGAGESSHESPKRHEEFDATTDISNNKRHQTEPVGNQDNFDGLFDTFNFDIDPSDKDGNLDPDTQFLKDNEGALAGDAAAKNDQIDGFDFDFPDFLEGTNPESTVPNASTLPTDQSQLNLDFSPSLPHIKQEDDLASHMDIPSGDIDPAVAGATTGAETEPASATASAAQSPAVAPSVSLSPSKQKKKQVSGKSPSPSIPKSAKQPTKYNKTKPETKRANTVPVKLEDQPHNTPLGGTHALESHPESLPKYSKSKEPKSKDKTKDKDDNPKSKANADDTSKLNDAIAAAGVDIQKEEELLAEQHTNRGQGFITAQQQTQKQKQYQAHLNAFLNPYHVAAFMNKVANQNGVHQNFVQDGELLELMSAACQQWLTQLIHKTITLSRHRRRGIPAINNKSTSRRVVQSQSSIPRSELSKELRNLAAKQKEMEEKRVNKRIALGLEKSADANGDASAKAGAEETLHRAANATAAMMAMNPGRKKYSWMTSSAGGGDDGAGGEKDGKNKQSSIISIRGDNGLRYREIRSGNSVTMKDLLGVIEDERMGTEKAVIKGYAKLKD